MEVSTSFSPMKSVSGGFKARITRNTELGLTAKLACEPRLERSEEGKTDHRQKKIVNREESFVSSDFSIFGEQKR